jgi:hypothetical protein
VRVVGGNAIAIKLLLPGTNKRRFCGADLGTAEGVVHPVGACVAAWIRGAKRNEPYPRARVNGQLPCFTSQKRDDIQLRLVQYTDPAQDNIHQMREL